ncbi:MAG: hypothetical protein KAI47_27600, partial [Deltaproteobacteria bacterium]|nr:hypothetical protein [Deltaproteobacteria bacterium]
DDTLRLLRVYPSGLMGLNFRMVDDNKVIMYTRNIERNHDDPAKRCWAVVGDFATLQTSEDHIMFRDLNEYLRPVLGETPQNVEPPEDILLAIYLGEDVSIAPYRWTSLAAVFENKTHTQPYHIPLLAAALVVETRFPLYSIVGGDISLSEVREAKAWAEDILGTPVATPLCMDRDRLNERLGKYLSEKELEDALDFLYLGARGNDTIWDLPSTLRFQQNPNGESLLNSFSLYSFGNPFGALFQVESPDQLNKKLRLAVDGVAFAVHDFRKKVASKDSSVPKIDFDDIDKDCRRLLRLLVKRAPVLTEDAWDWLRVENDPSMIEFLTFLIGLPNGNMAFWNARRSLFENRALCRYAAIKSQDASYLAKTKEDLISSGTPHIVTPELSGSDLAEVEIEVEEVEVEESSEAPAMTLREMLINKSMEEGLEQGLKEGREQGLKEGRQEARSALARKLLAQGITPAKVVALTKLSAEEVHAMTH